MTALVIGFDPANSTGWVVGDADARSDRDFVVDSGQCDFEAAMPYVFNVLGTTAPKAIGIELPIIARVGGYGVAASALQTSWKAGCLFGRCVTMWPSTPTPLQLRASEWRADLGLGKGGNKRQLIAMRVCAWVKATTGIDCGTGQTDAGSEIDRAMAIALAFVTRDRIIRKITPRRRA